MSSPYVVNLAKETGRPISEVEKYWEKAKHSTSLMRGIHESEFTSKDFDYTMGTVKNMLGLDESLSPSVFLNSPLSASQFLEEVISGDFNIGNVIPPTKDIVSTPSGSVIGDNVEQILNPVHTPSPELVNQDVNVDKIGLINAESVKRVHEEELSKEEMIREYIIMNHQDLVKQYGTAEAILADLKKELTELYDVQETMVETIYNEMLPGLLGQ